METYPVPNPQRQRHIPAQFSWIDHRLVRDEYFLRCSCEALALYLFLVTVADTRGISYYGQPSLMKQLHVGAIRFHQAREELIRNGLIAYQHPLYQVLALDNPPLPRPAAVLRSLPSALQQIRQQLSSGASHD